MDAAPYFRRLLAERRGYARYLVCLEIAITEVGGSFALRGSTSDVSLGGCYVATSPWPWAPRSTSPYGWLMKTSNRVAKFRRAPPGVGMGIQSIGLSDKDRRHLHEYLGSSVPTLPERMIGSYVR